MNATQLKLAKIQAQISLIEGSQDIFSDMSDLKELRQLQEDMKEFLRNAKDTGLEDLNPLAAINQYITELNLLVEKVLNTIGEFKDDFVGYSEEKLSKSEFPDWTELKSCLHKLEATGERFKFHVEETLEYLKSHELGYAFLKDEVIDIWSLGSIEGTLAPLTDEKVSILNSIKRIGADQDTLSYLAGYNCLHEELKHHLNLATKQDAALEEAKSLYASGELSKAKLTVESCEQVNYGNSLKQFKERLHETSEQLEVINSLKQLKRFRQQKSSQIRQGSELAKQLDTLESFFLVAKKRSRIVTISVIILLALATVGILAQEQIRDFFEPQKGYEATQVEVKPVYTPPVKKPTPKIDHAKVLADLVSYNLPVSDSGTYANQRIQELKNHAAEILADLEVELSQKRSALSKIEALLGEIDNATTEQERLRPRSVGYAKGYYANSKKLVEMIYDTDPEFYKKKNIGEMLFKDLFLAKEVGFIADSFTSYSIYVDKKSPYSKLMKNAKRYYFPNITPRVQKKSNVDEIIFLGFSAKDKFSQYNLSTLQNYILRYEKINEKHQTLGEKIEALKNSSLAQSYGLFLGMRSSRLQIQSEVKQISSKIHRIKRLLGEI